MATTHGLWGMALALPVAVVAPEFASIALLAGLIGGVAPDFDLYVGHRKTLHFPVYFSAATIPAVSLAVLVPSTWTVALGIGLAAAALHSVSDVLGGGLELKPWHGTSDRAVYDHYHGRWIPPRRWVRYDGAPEDFAVAGVVGVPLVVTTDGVLSVVVVALLVISLAYTLVRKPLATVATHFVAFVPEFLHPHVPARYFEN